MRPFGIFLTGLALMVGCGEKIEVEREVHAQTGQVITEYEYYHHPETHEKVRHGYYKTYHVAGKKGYREVGNYNHGQKTGVWTYYQENGNKYLDLILKGGNEQRFTFYYKNGNKKYEGKTKDGLREGFWTFYRESEKKESEGMYKKAKREGFGPSTTRTDRRRARETGRATNRKASGGSIIQMERREKRSRSSVEKEKALLRFMTKVGTKECQEAIKTAKWKGSLRYTTPMETKEQKAYLQMEKGKAFGHSMMKVEPSCPERPTKRGKRWNKEGFGFSVGMKENRYNRPAP